MAQKILVIDDDQSNLMLLAFAFKGDGTEIMGALSGQEALALLAVNSYDLVFIDIDLPDISGLILAGHFRQALPVGLIAMSTAMNNQDIIQQACLAGANLYIIKPYTIMDVVKFLRETPKDSLHQPRQITVIDNRSTIRTYQF
jgi:CheY-like chemotaxis protein